ncbi:ferritin-like domain-containing protein [Novosphingopyxis sp.]|uniref:YciE/YciF ferroxidase family protein n=1 Tax=Novosphingopyxis sp. TaxID=2709690 RepID=UPI003B5CE54A
MSAPKDLNDLYAHELQDLWSANEQMSEVVPKLADAAGDQKLKDRLTKAVKGIDANTEMVKQLLADMDEQSKEHCKGMEGLVKEAKKHALEAGIDDKDVRDVAIIAQYQRMCHYGICGFGTAKAFAEALGRKEDMAKLDGATEGIYDADKNMSDLAERSVNLHAKNKANA